MIVTKNLKWLFVVWEEKENYLLGIFKDEVCIAYRSYYKRAYFSWKGCFPKFLMKKRQLCSMIISGFLLSFVVEVTKF